MVISSEEVGTGESPGRWVLEGLQEGGGYRGISREGLSTGDLQGGVVYMWITREEVGTGVAPGRRWVQRDLWGAAG